MGFPADWAKEVVKFGVRNGNPWVFIPELVDSTNVWELFLHRLGRVKMIMSLEICQELNSENDEISLWR